MFLIGKTHPNYVEFLMRCRAPKLSRSFLILLVRVDQIGDMGWELIQLGWRLHRFTSVRDRKCLYPKSKVRPTTRLNAVISEVLKLMTRSAGYLSQ